MPFKKGILTFLKRFRLFKCNLCTCFFKLFLEVFSITFLHAFFKHNWCSVNEILCFLESKGKNFLNNLHNWDFCFTS